MKNGFESVRKSKHLGLIRRIYFQMKDKSKLILIWADPVSLLPELVVLGFWKFLRNPFQIMYLEDPFAIFGQIRIFYQTLF